LKNRCDRHPKKIRNVGQSNPFDVRVDDNERPDERGEDEEDVYGRKEVVLEAKLKVRKREIENEVEDKWQSNYCWKLLGIDLIKNRPIRHGDDSVKHRPHRPKDPRRWRPCGFY